MNVIVRLADAFWKRFVAAAVISCALVATAGTASAGNPPASQDQAAALVDQLGSPKFIERERAARELTSLGIVAKGALADALDHPDAEVRNRARAILAAVTDADYRARLAAFSADYDGSHQRDFPGWERFSKLFGKSYRARRLFVEMAGAEPELLEAYAAGGKAASDALAARCGELMDQYLEGLGRDAEIPLGTVTAVLLVGSAEDVAVDDEFASQLFSLVIQQPEFSNGARRGPQSPLLKKLLGQWVVKDLGNAASMQNLIYSVAYELRPEGLALATRLLTDEQANVQLRQFALLAVGRFGDKQQLSIVEKHLGDGTTCGAVQLQEPQRQVELQMRDVALAVALRLTDQQPDSYGASPVQSSPHSMFQVPALAFADAKQRDEAFRRWFEWKAEHR